MSKKSKKDNKNQLFNYIKRIIYQLTEVDQKNKFFEIYYIVFTFSSIFFLISVFQLYNGKTSANYILKSIISLLLIIIVIAYGRFKVSRFKKEGKVDNINTRDDKLSDELMKKIEEYGIDINDNEAVNKFLDKMIKNKEEIS